MKMIKFVHIENSTKKMEIIKGTHLHLHLHLHLNLNLQHLFQSSLSFTTIRNKISDLEKKYKPMLGTIVQVVEGIVPLDHWLI